MVNKMIPITIRILEGLIAWNYWCVKQNEMYYFLALRQNLSSFYINN